MILERARMPVAHFFPGGHTTKFQTVPAWHTDYFVEETETSESSDETDVESVCSVVPTIESFEVQATEIKLIP